MRDGRGPAFDDTLAGAVLLDGYEASTQQVEARLLPAGRVRGSMLTAPIDLLVRTGGEQRLSNFMLWQASYAELAFTPTLWPDFTREELALITAKFKKKDRRFGGL